MRDVYPGHFKAFRCIAGACDFTCCREWRIDADDAAFRLWQKTGIRNAVRRSGGRRLIRLTESGKCPFLSEDGLCSLIKDCGDALLPETCRVFPREVRVFPDRTEHSLMLACPAVVDLLQDGFSAPSHAVSDLPCGGGSVQGASGTSERPETEALREAWLRTVEESASPEEAFLRLFRVPEELRQVPEELSREERARLYEDLTENYRAEGLYRRFWEAEVQERVQGALKGRNYEEEPDVLGKSRLADIGNIWRDHADLLLHCIKSDIWSECLKPGFTEREMYMKLAWTAMKYAAVRRFTELHADSAVKAPDGDEGRMAGRRAETDPEAQAGADKSAGYHVLRDGIVLMTRVMSLDDEEIFAWLEETFDEPVWGPEYPALLFGGS